jgi:hypothetical protein
MYHLMVVMGKTDSQVPLNCRSNHHIDRTRQSNPIKRVVKPWKYGQ